MAITGFDTI
jgi:hypothetical protein